MNKQDRDDAARAIDTLARVRSQIRARTETSGVLESAVHPENGANAMAWIQTYTGRQFWPLAPKAEDVCIEDIAHALSNQCRFSGHVREFYSVAQHSVHVSQIVDPKHALWGLLHDAAEAYLVDVPKPLKESPAFAFYSHAEARVMAVVCEAFGLPVEMPPVVKDADVAMLHAEARDLMAPCKQSWLNLHSADALEVKPLHPEAAKRWFMDVFHSLTRKAA